MAGGHKITPANPRLATLLSDVNRGNIKIPVFQRQYVWDDEQIMGLLDSIASGYPVGSLLLWSTKEPLKHERNVGGFTLPSVPDEYPVNYVLDGQQRLTTLYGVFYSDAETADPELADRFNICYLPDEDIFVHQSGAILEDSINLRVFLDTTRLLPELERFSDEHKQRIAAVVEKFKDYEFPVVTIRDRTNQEVCRIFQRINSSGTSLSTIELLAAWTWSDQFDLRNEIESLLDRLSDQGYDQLDQSLLMRCLASIVIGTIDSDSLVDVASEELVIGMTTLKEAMYATIDFLDKWLSIKNFVFIPFPIMLVPLVNFFSKTSKPNSDQLTGLCRWFWHCSFTQRYKAGTNKMVLSDLASMGNLAAGEPVFDDLNGGVDDSLFMKTWRINSTAAKSAICLLAQFEPKSFLTGAKLDLGNALAAYNAREFHHIYPKAYLAARGIQFHESNVIANVCFLTSSDNKTISDRAPSEYFDEIPKTMRSEIMDAALIPIEAADGSKSFGEFIGLRAKKLEAAAEALIRDGRITGAFTA